MFALPAWWYSNRGYPRSNEARSSCRTDTNSVIKAEPEVFGFHTPSGGKGIFQSTTHAQPKTSFLPVPVRAPLVSTIMDSNC